MGELNKKLAEWAGFEKYATYGWDYPDGQWRRYLPYFDDSLDACFKWLVPKLYDLILVKLNRFESKWQVAYRAKVRLARKHWTTPISDKEPALALCLAIEKLIDGEKGDSI